MLIRHTARGRFIITTRSLGYRPAYKQLRTFATETVVDRDIVIVGGGPAGLALASALGSSPVVRQKCKISLVEGGDLDKIRTWEAAPGTYSNRVSSLTNSSQQFLKDIGAWSFVDESRTREMEEIQAWDGVSGARICFDAEVLGISARGANMARLTENLNLQRGLLRHLEQIPEVELLQRTKVSSITSEDGAANGWPHVQLDNGLTLRARLLIGADGFNSPVRNFAKISSYGWSYDTQAIVATMVHPPRGSFEGPNTTSYQRFLPTGPIAFLPLSPTVSSLVWSTKPAIAAALTKADPEILRSMINAAFRLPVVSLNYLYKRVLTAASEGQPLNAQEIQDEILWREQSHGIQQTSAYASAKTTQFQAGIAPSDSEEIPPIVTQLQPGSVASFPLRYNHADAYIGEGEASRTVLVGDAAHTIHPLAGQGLNLGLADAECLTRALVTSLSAGGDIGARTSLAPYARERYLANHTMMSAVDKLHKIYSTELGPLVWVRSVGVEVLNEMDSIKGAIMGAAGATGNATSATSPWALTGEIVEKAASASRSLQTIGNVLGGAATSALRNILQSRSRP